jgi:hypothetical protein
MEQAVEKVAAACLLITGFSHIVCARGWARFFILLRAKGEAGAFLNGFLSLAFGAVVVGFHNVWHGIPAVLTVLGWANLLKALVCFTYPPLTLRGMAWIREDNARLFVAPGVILAGIGALLAYDVLSR